MNDTPTLPGLEDEDSSPIAAVWSAPNGKLATLIEAGRLDPKTDFVRGDFRGWPFAGQDVRGIDFTGSDLRGTGIEHAIQNETTILTGAIMDDIPPPKTRVPNFAMEKHGMEGKAWDSHWHAGVHQAFGSKLYLVLLRFVTGSIFVKDSIIRNLKTSGITDYMIFNLYSQWDIAIRVWGDDNSIRLLKEEITNNTEVNHLHPEKYLKIEEILHFPDRGKYPNLEAVKAALVHTPTEHLKDAQQKGKSSEFFDKLSASGLIRDNEVRFSDKRIQFYIFIGGAESAPGRLRASLLKVVRESQNIRNLTVYLTSDGRTQAIVKGQVVPGRFYVLHGFLRRLTEELQEALRIFIETETMLVANQDNRHSALIDFDNAVRDPRTAVLLPADVLVAQGEGDKREFKSTLRVNMRTSEKDPRIELEVLKTIAAFVNTNGGTLIIGVDDDGKPLGLGADKFSSEDKMNLHLVNLIRDRIGPLHMISIHPRFGDYDNVRVFIVDCDRGHAAAFVKDGSTERFFMRTGAATTELSGSQVQEFIKHRFR